MNDTELRLNCVMHADGDLDKAQAIYDFVVEKRLQENIKDSKKAQALNQHVKKQTL